MKKHAITIPHPCTVPLQEMHVTDKGHFCDSCQKQVVDFTNMTDRQMIDYFKKNGPCCGSFRSSQLNREIAIPSGHKKWIPAAILAGMLAVIVPETGKAQERQVTGIIKSAVTGEPIPFAIVQILRTSVSTRTQADGSFILKIPNTYHKRIKIKVVSLGYEIKKIHLTKEEAERPMQVELPELPPVDGEVIIAGMAVME